MSQFKQYLNEAIQESYEAGRQQALNEIILNPALVGSILGSPEVDPRADWTWWDYIIKNNEVPPSWPSTSERRWTHGRQTTTMAK